MQILHLTSLQKILTDEAEAKIEAYQENSEQVKDDQGRSTEYFIDSLGIQPPKDLLDKEKLLDKGLELTEEDYIYLEVDCNIRLSQLSMTQDCVEEDYVCIVWLKDGTFVQVLQTSAEIEAQIIYLQRNVFEKIRDWIKNKLNRKVKQLN